MVFTKSYRISSEYSVWARVDAAHQDKRTYEKNQKSHGEDLQDGDVTNTDTSKYEPVEVWTSEPATLHATVKEFLGHQPPNHRS